MQKNVDQQLIDYVNEWLEYSPESGKFFWKKSSGRGRRQAGKEAATSSSHGYKLVTLMGKSYRAHRIAYLIMTGKLPDDLIDHIDRVKSNNVWTNLRNATPSLNCLNRNLDTRNKTGVTGVHFNTRENIFTVTHGKGYVGRSKDFFEAVCLRKSKEYNNEEKQ